MVSKKIINSLLKGWVLFLVMVILVACQGGLFSSRGKAVKEDRRLALLQGGPHNGVWQTHEVWVDYHYIFDQKNVQRPGVIELNGYVGYRIQGLDFLTVSVNFLDIGGKILDKKLIYNSGYRLLYGKKVSFKSKVETPPGTTAMAFTYAYTASNGHR